MNQSTAETKKSYMYLGAISIMLLLSAAIITPSLSAYAEHDNGNHKSKDDKSHQKDRKDKGHKEPKRCEHESSEKYNKHCEE